MAGLLQGKVALVTGGGSGIGRATAIIFAREGAKVLVADLNGEAAEQVKEEIIARGGEATAMRADVSKEADAEAMVKAAVDAFGTLTSHSTTPGSRNHAAEYPYQEWQRIIGISDRHLAQDALPDPWMREHGGTPSSTPRRSWPRRLRERPATPPKPA